MFSLSAAQFASTASSASLRSSQKSTKKSVRSSSMIVKNTASMDELDSTTTSSSSSDMVDIDSAMQRAESPTMNNGQTYSENKPETFKEIMGFAGWAPEVINCRAGMVAFVAAMGAELQSYIRSLVFDDREEHRVDGRDGFPDDVIIIIRHG